MHPADFALSFADLVYREAYAHPWIAAMFAIGAVGLVVWTFQRDTEDEVVP